MDDPAAVNSQIRVFLLDDHEIVRRGIANLIESADDLTVVGEAGTTAEALARIPAVRPDVAILDARLPDGSGIDVCRDIRSERPEIRCLILTSYDDNDAIFAAVMAGAAGYLLKEIRGNGLIDAIREVAAGKSLLDPSVTERLLTRLREGAPRDEKLDSLTGGPDQPADRGAAVPRREEREELRLRPVGKARHAAPNAGGSVRRADQAGLIPTPWSQSFVRRA